MKDVNQQRTTTGEPTHEISPRVLLYLYFIHCRITATNRFHDWFLHGIPRSYTTPLSWSADEVKELHGTNLGEAIPHRLRSLRHKWSNALPALTKSYPTLFPETEFTFDAFLWAHNTYTSRGFPVQLVDPSLAPTKAINPNAFTRVDASSTATPAGSSTHTNDENGPTIRMDTSDGSTSNITSSSSSSSSPSHPLSSDSWSSKGSRLGCLLPYVDFTNHAFKYPITWTYAPNIQHVDTLVKSDGTLSSEAHVLFAAGRTIPSGAEVLNNYGAKTNEEFLFGYGFTLRDNPMDEVTVVLGQNSLTKAKLRLLTELNIPLTHYLRRNGDIPEKLYQLIRISVMSEKELFQYSHMWLDAVAPGFNPTNHMSTSAVDASTSGVESSLSNLIDSTSTINPSFISRSNELTMLRQLATLFIGRLNRLRSRRTNDDQLAPLQSEVVDDANSTIRRLHPSTFEVDNEIDRAKREHNSKDETKFSYPLECAWNYRIGQREVLLSCLNEINRRLEIELARPDLDPAMTNYVLESYVPSTTSESVVKTYGDGGDDDTSSSTRDTRPTKHRKLHTNDSVHTQAAAETDASIDAAAGDVGSSLPSVEDTMSRLTAYFDWLSSIGAVFPFELTSTGWRLTREIKAIQPDGASTPAYTSYPFIASLPLDACISADSLTGEESFHPVIQLLNHLDEEDQLDEDELLALFIAFEHTRRSASSHHVWLDIAWSHMSSIYSPSVDSADLPLAVRAFIRKVHKLRKIRGGAKIITTDLTTATTLITATTIVSALGEWLEGDSGEEVKIILPIIHPPIRVTDIGQRMSWKLITNECDDDEEDNENSDAESSDRSRLVLTSLAPLVPSSHLLAVSSSSYATMPIFFPHLTNVVQSCQHQRTYELSYSTILESHLHATELNDDADGDGEEGSAHSFSKFGIRIHELSAWHQKFIERIGIDQTSTFTVTGQSKRQFIALVKGIKSSVFINFLIFMETYFSLFSRRFDSMYSHHPDSILLHAVIHD